MLRHSTILFLVFSIFSLPALFSQSSDTLSTSDARLFLYQIPSESSVLIEGLQKGSNYLLQFTKHDVSSECFPFLAESNSRFHSFKKQNEFITYEFKAIGSSEKLALSTSCAIEQPKDYMLSVVCMDCPDKSISRSSAPIQVVQNDDEQYLIEEVFITGGCFDVDNITKDGHPNQFGVFSNGDASLDASEGIILSTGKAVDAPGPNDDRGTSSGFSTSGGDADLRALLPAGSGSIGDVVSLEFDFTPTVDQVSFEYVFASEEYCEFVNSTFNDVFGFFISGPGINGRFSNNAINIAQIPGSADFVAINSVNYEETNQYYKSNIKQPGGIFGIFQDLSDIFGDGCTSGEIFESAPYADYIQYDGFTTLLTAVADVIPCETYHIKLVIGDVGDKALDSAVFLKANSFNAGGSATASVNVPNAVDPTGGIAFEGCQDANITFSRAEDDMSDPLQVTFSIADSSSAVAGEDYLPFQNSVTIPRGQMSVSLPIVTIKDDADEPVESIVFELDQACSCEAKTIEFFIVEAPPFTANLGDITTCAGGEITLKPSLEGGVGLKTYNWDDGQSLDSIEVTIDQATSYTVTVTDQCDVTAEATAQITIEEQTATIQGAQKICNGDRQGEIEINLSGVGPWNLTYTRDGEEQPVIEVLESPYSFQENTAGLYQIVEAESGGCLAEGEGEAELLVSELSIDHAQQNPTCFNTADGNITTTIGGNGQDLQYEWTTGSTERNLLDLEAGFYSLSITDNLDCVFTLDSIELIAPPAITAGIVAEDTINCITSFIPEPEITIEGGTPGHIFNIVDANGEVVEADQIGAGNFTVEVMDAVGCELKETFLVQADTTKPMAKARGKDNLSCKILEINLSGEDSSEEAGRYTYLWTTGDGNLVSDETTLSPVIDAPGLYQLVVTDWTNGCQGKDAVTVLANYDKPQSEIADPSTLNCQITETNIVGTLISSITDYSVEWKTEEGNIVSGQTDLSASVDAPGTYRMVITDEENGCKDSSIVNIIQDIAVPRVAILEDPVITCTAQNVTVVATVDGLAEDERTFSWNFPSPESIVSNRNTLEPVVSQPGEYTITVNNVSNFCESTVTARVSIDTLPPLADAGESFVFTCDLVTADLEGTSDGDNDYRWSTEDGSIEEGVQTLRPAISQAGNYELKVISNTNGCTATSRVTITEDPNRPEAIIAPPADLNCLNTTLPLNAEASSQGAIMDYRWRTEDGVLVDSSDPIRPIIGKEGSYQLQVINTESNCVGIAEVIVSLDTIAPIAFINPAKDFDCHTTTMQLDGTGSSKGDDFVYAWNTEDGSIEADATTLFPTIGEPGTYSLLITSSKNGCSKEQSLIVEENIPRSAMVEKVDPLCPNETGSINVSDVEGGIGPYRYSIDGGNSYQSVQTFDRIPAGTYAISIIDNNDCALTDQVNIVAPEEIELELDAEVNISLGDSATLKPRTNLPANEIADIIWSPPIGLSCDDCMQPMARPIKSQTYQLRVMDTNGCEATTTVQFLVDTNPDIYVPNAFSPNNSDGVNDRFTVFARASSIRVVKILRIFDRWGTLVFEKANFDPNDPNLGWDGRFNNQPMRPQVFVYFAEVEMIDDRDLMIRGDVALVE